jgi:hypothetical protein
LEKYGLMPYDALPRPSYRQIAERFVELIQASFEVTVHGDRSRIS